MLKIDTFTHKILNVNERFLKTAYIYILLSKDALKSFSSMVQDIPGFVNSHLIKIIFAKFPCNPHLLKKKIQQMKNTFVQTNGSIQT